ncbi:MAG: GIN domain-containing protein, partial [Bacteroidota bacterium]
RAVLVISLMIFISGCDPDDDCISGNGNYVVEEYRPGYFENVSNPFSGSVRLKSGDSKVKVSAESNLIHYLDIRAEGVDLRLGSDDICFSSHGIDFTFYSPAYKVLNNNGSADWTSDYLELDPVIISNGSGDIELTGESDEQDIRSAGSGDIDLRKMPANSVDIEVNGSGDVSVIAREYAEVKINGSGDVSIDSLSGILKVFINGSGDLYYSGSPAESHITTNGSGRVYRK